MKWKWTISFFWCVFLICMAYCYDYQRSMYEIERQQIEEMIGEPTQNMNTVKEK